MKNYNVKIAFVVCVIFILFSISGCFAAQAKPYYEDMNNYITEDATVENIIYVEERGNIVLWLSDIDPLYQAEAFIISGENASRAIENDILNKIKFGDIITFTSAPRYFGNGYFMPIIGLSIGDEVILDIEEGYKNLLDSL